jgi:hypothetical protein
VILRAQESKGLQPYKQGYQVNRVPLQARLMRNINMLGEKVSGIATKGKKMTRELKEYFRYGKSNRARSRSRGWRGHRALIVHYLLYMR